MIGTIASLWRYPVKSMRGDRQDSLTLDHRGSVGDRLFAVRDEFGKFGSGKTTRRFQRIEGLFSFHAVYDGDTPLITFPDGVTLCGSDPAIHARLTDFLGINVSLACEANISHFDAGPIHLVTTSSLRSLGALRSQEQSDERRFRPNIVIDTREDGFHEDSWEGQELLLGDEVRLRVTTRTERCCMVNFAQDELPADPHVLRTLARAHKVCLGVYAEVLVPGVLHRGDRLMFAAGGGNRREFR